MPTVLQAVLSGLGQQQWISQSLCFMEFIFWRRETLSNPGRDTAKKETTATQGNEEWWNGREWSRGRTLGTGVSKGLFEDVPFVQRPLRYFALKALSYILFQLVMGWILWQKTLKQTLGCMMLIRDRSTPVKRREGGTGLDRGGYWSVMPCLTCVIAQAFLKQHFLPIALFI